MIQKMWCHTAVSGQTKKKKISILLISYVSVMSCWSTGFHYPPAESADTHHPRRHIMDEIQPTPASHVLPAAHQHHHRHARVGYADARPGMARQRRKIRMRIARPQHLLGTS